MILEDLQHRYEGLKQRPRSCGAIFDAPQYASAEGSRSARRRPQFLEQSGSCAERSPERKQAEEQIAADEKLSHLQRH